MKIGIHLAMWSRQWDDDLSIYLEKIKDLGYDGVEMSLYGIDPEHVLSWREKLNNLGLEATFSTGVSADTDISSRNEGIRRQGSDYLMRAVDAVCELGGSVLGGVLFAPWMAFEVDVPRKERWERSAEALRQVADYAAQKEILLAVEPLNRFETDFMNTVQEGLDFISLVDRENMKLLLDTFHQNIEESDPLEAIRLAGMQDGIGHFHCSENHRGTPGSGHMDWHQIMKVLQSSGYDGWITIESFIQTANEVGHVLKIWRDVQNDTWEAAKQGITTLKQNI